MGMILPTTAVNADGVEYTKAWVLNFDKVREAFYMVDKSRSRNAGSAGLGLAITDQIIQIHHATMTIDSVLHQGTSITIHLKKGENNENI